MQEKKSMMKWLFVFNFIFLPMLLLASPTSIHKVEVRHSPTDVSICVKTYETSYDGYDNDGKSFIEITPKHAYTTSWSYNSFCLNGLEPHTKYHVVLHKEYAFGCKYLEGRLFL